MKIDLSLVLKMLRSYNAPSEVITAFENMKGIPQGKNCQVAIMEQANRLAEENSYVKRSDLQKRVLSLASFRNHPRGGYTAFNEAVVELVGLGKLRIAELGEAKAALNTTALTYQVLP